MSKFNTSQIKQNNKSQHQRVEKSTLNSQLSILNSQFSTFLPTHQIIKLAKNAGVDFGPGDPNERIRYFIKLGILPHAQRRAYQAPASSLPPTAIGHLSAQCVQTLVEVDKLYRSGLSYPTIAKSLKEKSRKAKGRHFQAPRATLVEKPIARENPSINLFPRIGVSQKEISKELEKVHQKIEKSLDSKFQQFDLASKIVSGQIPYLQAQKSTKIKPFLAGFLIITLSSTLVSTGLFLAYNSAKNKQDAKQTASQLTQANQNLGQVLAATSANHELYIDANSQFTGTAIFAENITAPNVIYGLSGGTGIAVSSGQNPTVGIDPTQLVTSLNSLPGALTITGSGGTSVSASGSSITINSTSGALTSESDTLSTVTGRGASTSTEISLNGGITSTGNLNLKATGFIRIGDDSATPDVASGDDDLYVLDDLEFKGRLVVGASGSGSAGTANQCLLSQGSSPPSWGGCLSGSTSFTLSGDSGTDQTLSAGDTIEIAGGTNGIDTVAGATDTVTLNFDSTEVGATTWGSASGFTWTFDAGATDPIFTFGSSSLTIGAAATIVSDQATLALFNSTTTTLSIGGAATTALNIGNGNTAYTAINIGSGTGGNTINIAGTGATGTDTINIGTGGTNADTITIGTGTVANSITIGTTTASASVAINDDNWNITGAGAANFVSIGATTTGTGAFTTFSSTPASTNDITLTTDADSTLIISGLSSSSGTAVCIDGSNNVITCAAGSGSSTLQNAYDNDTNDSDTIIAFSANDDGLIFRNPASGGIDTTSPVLFLDQLNTTGSISVLDITQASNAADAVNLTANSIDTENALDISATSLTSGVGVKFTGPSGGTAGITGSGISITSDLGNGGELLNLSGTIDTTSDTHSAAGISNVVSHSTVLATTVSQTHYGIYSTLTKTGADTTSGTIALYGGYTVVSNTGGDTAATRNTYGAYFSATGDTSGTTNAYGIYATASGGDNNYAGYFVGAATGEGIRISGASSGKGISFGSLSDVGTLIYSGPLIAGNKKGINFGDGLAVSASTAFTGIYVQVDTGYNYQDVNITETGNYLKVARSNLMLTANTLNVDGDLVTFSSNCGVAGGGTCNDSSNILELNQQYATASGAVLNITNSATTNDVISISSTALTTGSVFVVTGPTTTGVTDHFFKLTSDVGSGGSILNLNPDFSGSAVTGYGIYQAATDSTGSANTDYGLYNLLTLSGNAAKVGIGLFSTITSSSTTGDSTYGAYLTSSITGAISSGSRNTYGLYSAPANTATNTGGTSNIFGSALSPAYTASADVSSSTVNVYGDYITTSGSLNTGGAINQYGVYVADGTSSATGTSTKYGVYIASPTGADTNRAIFVAGATSEFDGTIQADGTLDSNGDLTVADTDIAFDGASTTFTVTGALTINTGGTITIGDGGDALSVNSAEFDVASATGAITIDDDGNAGNITIEGTVLDINSLDFVAAGAITTGSNTSLTITPGGTGDLVVDTDSDSQVTLNGGGDGIDSLVLTDGDILVSDGDLDLSGGDFNVTLDAGDSASIAKGAATGATAALAVSNTTAGSDTSGSEGLDIALTVTDYTDDGTADTHVGIDLLLTNNFDDAGTDDNYYGLRIQDIAGTDSGTEYGIYQAGTSWDYGLYTEDAAYFGGTVTFNSTIQSDDITISSATPSLFLTDTDGGAEDYSVNANASSFTIRNESDGRDDLTISGAGIFTISGASAGEGTSTLNLTSGDFTITDGDFVISSGEISFTTDDITTDAITIAASTLTSGSAVVATGSTTTGVTDHFFKLTSDVGSGASLLNLNPDFSGSAVTGYGIYQAATDSTASANTNYGIYGSLALSGNAAKVGFGISSSVTSTSTTGDTLYGNYIYVAQTGAVDGSNKLVYGLASIADSDNTTSGDTSNVYSGYFSALGDTGGTGNAYGIYTSAGGADLGYGIYTTASGGYGIFSAAGNDVFTLGANEKVYINATTTSNSGTAGILDIDVTTPYNGVNVRGIDLSFTSNLDSSSYNTPATDYQYGIYSQFTRSVNDTSFADVTTNRFGIYQKITQSGDDTCTTLLATCTFMIRNTYGIYGAASVTGTANEFAGPITRTTFAGYFSATGSTDGTTPTTYGIYTTATGASINYGLFSTGANTANVFTATASTITTGVVDVNVTSTTASNYGISLDYTANQTSGSAYGQYNLLTHSNASGTSTAYGIYGQINDATALGNTNVAYFAYGNLTGNAAKTAYGYYGTVTSSSTTADNLYGAYNSTTRSANAASVSFGTYGIVSSSSTTADSLYGGYFKTSATGNSARTANYGAVAYGQTSSTTGDTVFGSQSYGLSTGATTTGTRNIYGAYNVSSAAAYTSGSSQTTNNYGTFSLITNPTAITATSPTITSIASYGSVAKSLADSLTTGGTFNLYGIYGNAVNTSTDTGADGTRNTYGGYFEARGATAGTTAAYGIYATGYSADFNYNFYGAAITAVTTANYGLFFGAISGAGSNYGIYGSVTTGAGGDAGIFLATTIEGIGGTQYGIYNATSDDGDGGANTDYGIFNSLTLTGNTAKVGFANYGIVTSNSTTADSLYGGYFKTSATGNSARTANYGIVAYGQTSSTTADTLFGSMSYGLNTGSISSGTKNIYGAYNISSTTSGGTGGTINNYATFSLVTSPGAVTATSPTHNYLGLYGSATKAGADNLTTAGTFNQYGVYGIASNTSTDGSAAGTRTTFGGYFSSTGAAAGTTISYGVYAASDSGADTNYGILASATDSTTAANKVYGVYSNVPSTGNGGAKVSSAFYGIVSSSNTTADSLYGGYFNSSATGDAARTTNYGAIAYGQTSSTTGDTVFGSESYGLSTDATTTGTRTIYGAYNISAAAPYTSGSSQTTNNYGTFSLVPDPGVITATSPTYTSIGTYGSTTKTGTDVLTTSGTFDLYGAYGIASNTSGDTDGTRTTFGGYFSATGAAAGTTKAYGIYATASGGDNNYGLYTNSNSIVLGNFGVGANSSLGAYVGLWLAPNITNLGGNSEGIFEAVTLTTSNTNHYNHYIANTAVSGVGAVTNNYGIFVDNQTTGSSDYGIWVNGADTFGLVVNGTTRLDLASNTSDEAICGNDSDGITADVTINDCSGAPQADYAEIYPTASNVEFKDVLVTGSRVVTYKGLDSQGNIIEDGSNPEHSVELVKSSTPYDDKVIGVASNNYGDFSSVGHNRIDETDHPLPVSLSGRVRVKVTGEGGAINVGDLLTSSSTPGVAMKADPRLGSTFGKALTGFSDPGTGEVLVFIEINTRYNLAQALQSTLQGLALEAKSAQLADGNFTVDSSGNTTIQGSLTVGLPGSPSGGFTVYQNGDVVAQNISAASFSAAQGTLGSLYISGDTTIGGQLTVGSLQSANIEAPIGQDLNISLGDSAGATSLVILNSIEDQIFTLSSLGDANFAGVVRADSFETHATADLAEKFATKDESIGAGDIVAVDQNNKEAIQLSHSPYDSTLLGVVSTKPGLTLNSSGGETNFGSDGSTSGFSAQPVALAGRVPVKVSGENGEIRAGDPITSSSTPGVGMRATQSGRVIGIALENYDGTSGDDCSSHQKTALSAASGEFSSTRNPASQANSIITNNNPNSQGSGDAGNRTPESLLERQDPHQATPTPGELCSTIIVFVNPSWYMGTSLADNGSFSSQSTVNGSQLATVNSQLITDNQLNSDGTLASEAQALQDKHLTEADINRIVDEKLNSLIASGRLNSTSYQQQATSNQIDAPIPTPSVLGNSTNESTSSAESSASAAIASGEQVQNETQATLDKLDELMASHDLSLSTLTVTGQSNLAQTQVAGTFSQDGTLIIDYGKQINVLGSTLYFQNDSLAGCPNDTVSLGVSETVSSTGCTGGILIDIGNGKLTLGKDGTLKVASIVAQKVETQELNISASDNAPTVGSSQIGANQRQITIFTTAIKPQAKILVTPTTPTGGKSLYIVQKADFESFTVALDGGPATKPVTFDWFIVNTQISSLH